MVLKIEKFEGSFLSDLVNDIRFLKDLKPWARFLNCVSTTLHGIV